MCAALEWVIYRRVTMITIVGGVALVWSFLMLLYTTLQQYKRDETPIGDPRGKKLRFFDTF